MFNDNNYHCGIGCIHVFKYTDVNNSQFRCISCLELLFEEIERYENINRSYIFRGQANKDFHLQPNIFRQHEINRLLQNFSNIPYFQWCSSQEVKDIISKHTQQPLSINDWEIKRLCAIIIYVMQYNCTLTEYIQKNVAKFDSAGLALLYQKPSEYWKSKEVFLRGFGEYMAEAISIIGLDNRILKEGKIINNLTCFDEALPQHYGVPTAALDWSDDPRVALFFAIQNIPENSSHISLFIYQETQLLKDAPIAVNRPDFNINNKRIIAQKGLFIGFQKPCSFYFKYGRPPCIEDYLNTGSFELLKFNIPICHIDRIRKNLIKNDINENTLRLVD